MPSVLNTIKAVLLNWRKNIFGVYARLRTNLYIDNERLYIIRCYGVAMRYNERVEVSSKIAPSFPMRRLHD